MNASAAPVTASAAFACATCGGQGVWHAGRQEVVCPSCGTAVATQPEAAGPVTSFAVVPLLRDRPNSGRDWQAVATRVRCTACNAIMEYGAGVAGRNCEACGSPALMPSDETGAPVSPSGVLPFRITESDARTRLAAWLAGQPRFGARRRPAIDLVRALYLPCWTFSARVSCRYRGETYRINREGRRIPIPVDGIVERAFADFVVPASPSVPSDLLRPVEPFPMTDCAGYDTRYLAGYQVEVYGVNMWDAWDAASQRMTEELNAELKAESECSLDALETWPEWSAEQCVHVLVPAYTMTCRHARETFEAVVNGYTGTASAKLPRDVLGEILGVLILLTIVAILGYGLFWIGRAIL